MYRYLLIFVVFYSSLANGQSNDLLMQPLLKHEVIVSYNSIYSVWNTINTFGLKQYGQPEQGYGLSVIFSTIFNRYFNLQSGLIYHNMGYKLPLERHQKYELFLNNIQIPILATINTNKFGMVNYFVFAGPQFTYNISSTYLLPETTIAFRDTIHEELSVNCIDFGLAYGAGGDIAINKTRTIRIEAGYRGSLGFTDRSGKMDANNIVNIIPQRTTINTFGGYIGLKMVF